MLISSRCEQDYGMQNSKIKLNYLNRQCKGFPTRLKGQGLSRKIKVTQRVPHFDFPRTEF